MQRNRLQRSFEKAVRTKKPDKVAPLKVKVALSKDGAMSERSWEIENIPIVNSNSEVECIFQAVTDVTCSEEKKVSKDNSVDEIRRMKANQEALLNGTDDLMWSVDKEIKIISANQPFIRRMKEMTGKTFCEGDEILPEISDKGIRTFWESCYQKALKGQALNFVDSYFNAKTSHTEYMQVSIIPVYDHKAQLRSLTCHTRDISESTRNRQTLEMLSKELMQILDSSLDVICTLDEFGRFVNVSGAAKKVWGYLPLEMVGKEFTDFIPQEEVERSLEVKEVIMKGKSITNFENHYFHKNGFLVPMVWSSNWDPEERLFYCIARDASEMKKSELEMHLLLSNTDESFIIVDKKLNIVAFNRQCEFIYKKYFNKEIVKGRSILDYAISSDTNELKNLYRKVFKGSIETQLLFIPADDGPRVVSLKFKPAVNDKGKIIGAFISAIDSTAAVMAQRELKESEKKYKFLFENNPSPMLIWDFKTRQIIDCNEEALLLYGYTRDEFLQLDITRIRPEEDIEILNKYTASEEIYGEVHHRIWRHKKKNGEIRMVEVHGHLVTYNKRRVSIAQITDVTEKIKAQKQIKDSEERFRVLFYNSPMPIWVYDIATLKIVDVNERAIDHYGYSRDEFLGMTINDIKPHEELERVEKFRDEIENGTERINFGIFTQLKKDKTRIKADVSGNKLSFLGKDCMVIVSNDVTERENVLAKLKEKEERLLSAQRIAKLGYWQTIPGSNHLFWSDMVYDIWGVDKSITSVSMEFFKNSLHPDDVDAFAREHELVFAGKKDHDLEHRIVLKDGSVKWVHEKGKIVKNPDGEMVLFEGTVQDITIEKELSLSLQKSNERFERVAEATNDIIWEWDMINRQLLRGKEFRKLFGANDTLPADKPEVSSLNIHPDDLPKVVKSVNEALANKEQIKWESEYRFLKADECYMYVLDRGFIIRDENGNAIRMVGAMTDITDRKNYEESLKRLNDELGKANKDLAISNAELEQFAYIASHDLQEPLRMVSSFLTQIEKNYGEMLDEKGKKYIYFAVDGASRMRQIILDLLEYSRVGRLESNKEVVDFRELVNEVLILQRRQIEDTGAIIEVGELPVIETFKTPLRQILQNLVGNSLRFNKKNQTEEPLTIEICSKDNGCHWLFSVKDSGIGIHPAYFERIFVIFQRLHNKEDYPGTGMGLAITKKIVESLGGEIWVESEVNKGSIFYFTLPKC